MFILIGGSTVDVVKELHSEMSKENPFEMIVIKLASVGSF